MPGVPFAVDAHHRAAVPQRILVPMLEEVDELQHAPIAAAEPVPDEAEVAGQVDLPVVKQDADPS
ncbi:MAG TPA: hypothetical protein VF210_16955 [Pseudomonadales bacterium]